MEKVMLNYGSNVCDNDSTSIFKDIPNNELLQLLKTKKHARMFVHMLKYIEHKNHVLHNSLCELNSLIKKYKEEIEHCVTRLITLKREFNQQRE